MGIDQELGEAYERAIAAIPYLRDATVPTPTAAEHPGSVLVDRDWLSARIVDTARRWACDDARVSATLWWYSASSTLLSVPASMLLATGLAPDPSLAGLTCTLRTDGYLGTVRSVAGIRDDEVLADRLRAALDPIIAALSDLSGAGVRSLWAIATDSLGNRALDAGTALGSPALGSALAVRLADLIGPDLPRPRFVDVGRGGPADADPRAAPASGSRRVVRRSSCCLIYETEPDPVAAEGVKCTSCPRQQPSVRAARLGALLG
ncbi:(2Fe-2S)-binding protein [Rhodococcus maanshanensis]|uniref:FhuF 2Fe-2S C-terminal domain-containing protein n=1 Tax=Rhodococcus maanshanensis TaxID=183556 RepID=A0A1H7QHB2_9NOCA|nr:(2Fe-2S)-binding protein [Rhodococcus maanshanensis]SEL47148.1 FhuF 2Fe-2S C-terminal domain-containing protein [Rhodococcus maanshanensis]